jgi:hypothetical protein
MKMNTNFVLVIVAVAECALFSIMIIFTSENDSESFDNISVKGVCHKN